MCAEINVAGVCSINGEICPIASEKLPDSTGNSWQTGIKAQVYPSQHAPSVSHRRFDNSKRIIIIF